MNETVSLDPAHAVAVVADLLERLDDANPDVGRGPSRSVFIGQARSILGVSKEAVSDNDVAAAARNRDKVIGVLMLAVEQALTLSVFAGQHLPSRVWRKDYEPMLVDAVETARTANREPIA
ncbi:MAG: hypothetical protein K2X45_13380 [Phreatobacter sp.]|nr:hypothetical protein [Phreatobacter sp.]